MLQRTRLNEKNRNLLNKQPKKTSGIFPALQTLLLLLILIVLIYPKLEISALKFNFKTDSVKNHDTKAPIAVSVNKKINSSERSIPAKDTLIKKDRPKTETKDTSAIIPKKNIEKKTIKLTSDKKKLDVKPHVSLQILNGCGKNGIADKFEKYLTGQKHKVTSTGNYKSFNVKYSFIICQNKKNKAVYTLAADLQIPKSRIKFKKVNSRSEVIFVIGKDYYKFPPFKKK